MKNAHWILLATMAVGCDRQPSTSSGAASTPATQHASALAEGPSPSVTASSSATTTASDVGANKAEPTAIQFNADTLGAVPSSFEPVVGDWYVAENAGQRGLRVDGSKWKQGTPSASLADQAKRLYGDRYAEFLDGVKAFAFFPLAIYQGESPKGDVRIALRFYPEAGRIDQAAGIAFDIAPDGSYEGVRANALEDNILYFTVTKGKRTILETVRNTPTATQTWHTLAISIHGRHLIAELDGAKKLERQLAKAPTGRVGIWSKADSQVLFDDFSVR